MNVQIINTVISLAFMICLLLFYTYLINVNKKIFVSERIKIILISIVCSGLTYYLLVKIITAKAWLVAIFFIVPFIICFILSKLMIKGVRKVSVDNSRINFLKAVRIVLNWIGITLIILDILFLFSGKSKLISNVNATTIDKIGYAIGYSILILLGIFFLIIAKFIGKKITKIKSQEALLESFGK